MTQFVRIRTENGMEASVSQVFAESIGAKVLDDDATNLRGRPLPATRKGGRPVLPRTTAQAEAAKKTASGKAANKSAGTSTPTGGRTADSREGDSK